MTGSSDGVTKVEVIKEIETKDCCWQKKLLHVIRNSKACMPESLPGLIKGNLFGAGGWERKETVGRGSSIAMHWAEPGCAPRAKSRARE